MDIKKKVGDERGFFGGGEEHGKKKIYPRILICNINNSLLR